MSHTWAGCLVWIGILLAQTNPTWASSCPELSDFLAVYEKPAASLLEKAESRERSAQRIFQAYFERRVRYSQIETCLLEHPARQTFLDTIQRYFYQESLSRMRGSAVPALQNLLKLLDQRNSSGHMQLFRFTGHFNSAPAPYKAGVSRHNGSIFAELDRIDPTEWYLVLIHEILHSLDSEIQWASLKFSDKARIAKYEKWALEVKRPDLLSEKQRQELSTWIEAGLSRGLWYEHRAWLATFVIYEAMLKSDPAESRLWEPISWMEEVRSQRRADESWRKFLFRYLDERMVDPQEGLFSTPLLQEMVREIRKSYRDGSRSIPSLGVLELIVDDQQAAERR